jgi:hypothetical protein
MHVNGLVVGKLLECKGLVESHMKRVGSAILLLAISVFIKTCKRLVLSSRVVKSGQLQLPRASLARFALQM